MKYKINLTKHKKKSLEERLIFFSLNYFRYVIVITQLFIIAVFFYRYKVDQEIVDLGEQVSQKEEIIRVSNPLVKEGRLINKKSEVIASVFKKQTVFGDMISYVSERVPQGVKLTKLSVKEGSVKVEGNSRRIGDIRLMVEKINREHKFKQVNLIDVEKKIDNFYFHLDLKDFLFHDNR